MKTNRGMELGMNAIVMIIIVIIVLVLMSAFLLGGFEQGSTPITGTTTDVSAQTSGISDRLQGVVGTIKGGTCAAKASVSMIKCNAFNGHQDLCPDACYWTGSTCADGRGASSTPTWSEWCTSSRTTTCWSPDSFCSGRSEEDCTRLTPCEIVVE